MLKSNHLSAAKLQQFSQQLSVLLKAGIILIKALEILRGNHSHPHWKKLLQAIQNDIEQGLNLHEALRKFPSYFADYYCCLIQCGEKTGRLSQTLEQLASYQAMQLKFKQKCWRALAYPSFVLITSLMISLGILLWIIPLFSELFAKNQHALPRLTQILLNFSQHLVAYSLIALFSLITGIYSIILASRAYFPLQWILIKLSVQCLGLRYLIQLIQLNRWLPLMSSHLQAGMHLFESLSAASNAFNHLYYAACYARLINEVQAGANLSKTMRASGIFPENLINLIVIGEESGNIPPLFVEATMLYEQKLESFLFKTTQLIEPLSLLLVSLLIGMLIIALYLPLFNVGDIF